MKTQSKTRAEQTQKKKRANQHNGLLTEALSGGHCLSSEVQEASGSPGIQPYLSADLPSSDLSEWSSAGARLPRRLLSWTMTQAQCRLLPYLPTFLIRNLDNFRTQCNMYDRHVHKPTGQQVGPQQLSYTHGAVKKNQLYKVLKSHFFSLKLIRVCSLGPS